MKIMVDVKGCGMMSGQQSIKKRRTATIQTIIINIISITNITNTTLFYISSSSSSSS